MSPDPTGPTGYADQMLWRVTAWQALRAGDAEGLAALTADLSVDDAARFVDALVEQNELFAATCDPGMLDRLLEVVRHGFAVQAVHSG